MNTRKIGEKYERVAEEYLKGLGYEILERNYRSYFGEIDLILWEPKDDIIIYCEVKYRSSSLYGSPLEAVDARKQRKISRTAFYHQSHDRRAGGKKCRFDVIGIYKDNKIEHIKGAFEYRE